jgi:hypothetical protein
MPAGRPTTYTQELIEKAYAYLDEWKSLGDMIPSVEGLAEHIDRARSTIYKWDGEEDKPEISDTLARINELQKRILINNGLSGDFNSNITKLVLGNHGLSEKLQQEHTGANGGPIQTTQINFIPVGSDKK